MKFKDYFHPGIEPSDIEHFEQTRIADNLSRAKTFTLFIVCFDVILTVTDIVSSFSVAASGFHFYTYLTAYLLMILVNLSFYFYIKRLNRFAPLARSERIFFLYICFFLVWGSIVSLFDQEFYGQLTVFMVNMVFCSVFFFLKPHKMILVYVLSTVLLYAGLPFVQHSTDVLVGHYINVTVFVILSIVSCYIMYFNYCKNYQNKCMLEKANRDLQYLSYVDELTGLANRRSLKRHVEEHSFEKGDPVSVIMIDIDRFKQYNDEFGHAAGDAVLALVAKQILHAVESSREFAARLGGEEFLFLAYTDRERVMQVAEEIRRSVEKMELPPVSLQDRHVTVSLGVATVLLQTADDFDRCSQLADQMLYEAKRDGRNCIKYISVA